MQAYDERITRYFRRAHPHTGSTTAKVLMGSLFGLSALAASGFATMVLNLSSQYVYSPGCVDHFLQNTSSPIKVTALYQWLFVLLTTISLACSSSLIHKLVQNRFPERARSVYMSLNIFIMQAAPCKAAIHNWRSKVPSAEQLTSTPRRSIYWMLHLPFLILASTPAIGFVSTSADCDNKLTSFV